VIAIGELTLQADSSKRHLRKILEILSQRTSWDIENAEEIDLPAVANWSQLIPRDEHKARCESLINRALGCSPPAFGVCTDRCPWNHASLDWVMRWLETCMQTPFGELPRFSVIACLSAEENLRIYTTRAANAVLEGLLVHLLRLGLACLKALTDEHPQGLVLDFRARRSPEVDGKRMLKSLPTLVGLEERESDILYQVFNGLRSSLFKTENGLRTIQYKELRAAVSGRKYSLNGNQHTLLARTAAKLNHLYKGKIRITGVPKSATDYVRQIVDTPQEA